MWTRKLPTVDGFYWFRDENRMTPEHGIALVDVVRRTAKILIWPSDLDGERYVSDAHWLEGERWNANWEWYGPLEQPK